MHCQLLTLVVQQPLGKNGHKLAKANIAPAYDHDPWPTKPCRLGGCSRRKPKSHPDRIAVPLFINLGLPASGLL